MTKRVDFSSTNDMERVVEAAESLGAFPDLEDDVERLAQDRGLDVIVHLGRLRDRTRKVLEVAEVRDYREGEIRLAPLYSYEETGERDGKIQGIWRKDQELVHREKLLAAGDPEA